MLTRFSVSEATEELAACHVAISLASREIPSPNAAVVHSPNTLNRPDPLPENA